MFKKFCVLFLLLFNYNCAQHTASLVSSGIGIASGASVSQTTFTSGANIFLKETTGKDTLEHVTDNTLNAEVRNCEINHSAGINKIFFITLDQIDCDRKYLDEANLYYLR